MGRLMMLQLHRVWIWSRDTMRRIIADIDTDGNGEIDWEEMKEALSRFKDTVKGEIRKALKVLRNDDDMEEIGQLISVQKPHKKHTTGILFVA
eukprot:g25897.t1